MNKVPIRPSEAFPLSPDERASFAGSPQPYRISGPPGLVRSVQRGRSASGSVWTEEPVFATLRARAKQDLMMQSRKQPFARPMKEMIGMYMKHCLRFDLAICKDWTANFDAYAVLPLRPMDSLVAWVGPIKNQPYYSAPRPNEPEFAARKLAYDQAEAGGVRLLASEEQYVVHFDLPANAPFASRILGPFEF